MLIVSTASAIWSLYPVEDLLLVTLAYLGGQGYSRRP